MSLNNILAKIIQQKQIEVSSLTQRFTLSQLHELALEKVCNKNSTPPLQKRSKLGLISEIKRKSPSKKLITVDFDPVRLVDRFQKNSSAISVLTDNKFFSGSVEIFKSVRKLTPKPLLRKDFIIDESQVYETRIIEADLILLIYKVLETSIEKLIKNALKLGLQVLIEVHDQHELKQTLKILTQLSLNQNEVLIGINNRNLDTFITDINTSLELINMIPSEFVTISESSITNQQQLTLLQQKGFDYVLIGEGLQVNPDLISYFDYP